MAEGCTVESGAEVEVLVLEEDHQAELEWRIAFLPGVILVG